MMTQQDAPAVAIARAHIEAWSHHDWEKTRELLAPNVHAVVTTTQPGMLSDNQFWPFPKLNELACPGEQRRSEGVLEWSRGEVRGQERRLVSPRLTTDQIAWSNRCRNRGGLAVPNMARLTTLI